MADGSFSYDIVSSRNRINAIRHIISAEKGLFILTDGEIFLESQSQREGRFSIDTVEFRSVDTVGASKVTPLVVNGAPFIVPTDRRKLNLIDYIYNLDRMIAQDITITTPHIAADQIKELHWQHSPLPLLWCITDTGALASLTWEREQQVRAWARHDPPQLAQGHVQSMSIIPTATGGDEILMVIKRGDGQDSSYNLEILQEPFGLMTDSPDKKDAWHLFAATRGEDGELTGLSPDNQHIETLDWIEGARDGLSHGRQKRIKAIGLRLINTADGEIALITQSEPYDKRRTNTDITLLKNDGLFDDLEMYSGYVDVSPPSGWSQESRVRIKAIGNEPITLATITPMQTTANG